MFWADKFTQAIESCAYDNSFFLLEWISHKSLFSSANEDILWKWMKSRYVLKIKFMFFFDQIVYETVPKKTLPNLNEVARIPRDTFLIDCPKYLASILNSRKYIYISRNFFLNNYLLPFIAYFEHPFTSMLSSVFHGSFTIYLVTTMKTMSSMTTHHTCEWLYKNYYRCHTQKRLSDSVQ